MKSKIFLIILLLSLFIGCQDNKLDDNINTAVGSELFLPRGAEVLENLDNGWIIFTLKGNKFLFREYKSGYQGYSCLTQIIEKDSL